MKFIDLDIHPSFHRALADHGFEEATPVQEAVLADEVRERDLLVSSRTGSGKTVAFGLAMGERLLGDAQRLGAPKRPLALIVAPTRELALQVQRELQWLYAPAGGRIASCVGGMDIRREMRLLQEGAHIVVGTPGRLCDHLDRKTLDLSGAQAVVLDEADEMLDMGFREDLERILQQAPAERRTLLFSATLPKAIEALAKKYQVDAARITATSTEIAHQDIEYRAHLIAAREREHAVVNVLRSHEPPRALVFCATREGVSRLSANLLERGFDAVSLSGELSQAERTRALKALRDGRARVLVATDVAARGLDLPEVGLVIHADLPMDASVLQHRSGRTGRAGRKGISVVLAPISRRVIAERMLRAAKVEPRWSPVPDIDEIRALDSERLQRELSTLGDEISREDLEVARSLLEDQSAELLLAGLVREHRARRPAPEDLPQTTAAAERLASRGRGAKSRAEEPWSQRPGTQRPGTQRPSTQRPSTQRPGTQRDTRRSPGGVSPDEGIWFRLNVGSARNADPRWLVPLLCRRGRVSNRDIGRIEILERESRFQISPEVAESFAVAAAQPDSKDPAIRIERLAPGKRGEPASAARGPRPYAGPAPKRPRGFRDDEDARPARPRLEEERPSAPQRRDMSGGNTAADGAPKSPYARARGEKPTARSGAAAKKPSFAPPREKPTPKTAAKRDEDAAQPTARRPAPPPRSEHDTPSFGASDRLFPAGGAVGGGLAPPKRRGPTQRPAKTGTTKKR